MKNICFCGKTAFTVVDDKLVCPDCLERLNQAAARIVKSEPKDMVPILLGIVKELLEQNK
jgi:hypothetical protein